MAQQAAIPPTPEEVLAWKEKRRQATAPVLPAGGQTTATPAVPPTPADAQAWLDKRRAEGTDVGAFGNLSKAATIDAPMRRWWEDLAAGIPAIPAAIRGAATGARIGAPIYPPYGAIAGGIIGGVGGAAAGGAVGDVAIAGPLSMQRRGVIDTPETMAKQAVRQAEGQAIGQVLGGPFGAAVGKARQIVTRTMPGFRPDIARRFYRAVIDDKGRAITSLTPARVGESRTAELLENFGRPALRGGERFTTADQLQQIAILEEASKLAMDRAAKPIIVPPPPGAPTSRITPTTMSTLGGAARESAEHAKTVGGTTIQRAISNARDAFMKEGQDRLTGMLKQANAVGATIPRRVVRQDGTVEVVQESLQKAHARTIALGRKMRELGLQADKNPELRNSYRKAVKAYSKARTAIERNLENTNPAVKEIWDDAMDFWRDGARLYYSRPVSAVKGFGNTGARPEEVVDLMVRGKLPTEKVKTTVGERMKTQPELISRIKEAANNPEAWEKVQESARYALLDEATNAQGWIVGDDLSHMLSTRGAELQAILGDETVNNFKKFAEQLQFLQRNRPDIGRIFVQLGQVSAAVNIAQGNVTWMRAALVGVPQLIARVLTSPEGFKFMTQGMEKASKAGAIGADVAQYFPPRFLSILADEWLELAAETDIDQHEVEEDQQEGVIPAAPPARAAGPGPLGVR